jgi:hypothetical protein
MQQHYMQSNCIGHLQQYCVQTPSTQLGVPISSYINIDEERWIFGRIWHCRPKTPILIGNLQMEKISTCNEWSACMIQNLNVGACENKWRSTYGDFKHIFNTMSSTKNNTDYLTFISQEKTTLNFLKNYSKFVYDTIEVFMGTRPMFHPPHIWNLMLLNDSVYTPKGQLDLQMDPT